MPYSIGGSAMLLSSPSKVEQIRQMHLDDVMIMNEAFAEETGRDSSYSKDDLVCFQSISFLYPYSFCGYLLTIYLLRRSNQTVLAMGS
jgi:hypothetical protein